MELKFSKILEDRLAGENLSAIARKLDMPKALLHDWVQSKRLPSLKNIGHVTRLADYLGLSLEELLIGENQKKVLTSIEFEDSGRKYQVSVTRIK